MPTPPDSPDDAPSPGPHRPDTHPDDVRTRPERDLGPDGPPPGSRYQRLDDGAVRRTTAQLQARIRDRFPDRSLWEVCGELLALVDEVSAADSAEGVSRRRIRLARWLSRFGVLLVVGALGAALGLAAIDIARKPDTLGPLDWLPLIETAVNDVVFGGIAVFFLRSVPDRMERTRVLTILHRLRSLAHVIDMHQLSKDPERPMRPAHAPGAQTLTRDELARYLDYCTEMLSLVGKTAALFAEDTTDGDVLDAVEGIETLTSDASRKIWQKIALLPSRE